MITAIVNEEVIVLNEVPENTGIAAEQITEYEGKKYFNPDSAIIVPDAPAKPSPYHQWDGTAWIADDSRKQELIAELEVRTNADTDQKILTGFSWNGNSFYLSLENQMNFKALNDIRDTLTYPVKVKHQAGYTEIASAEDYHSFYLAGMAFIQLKITDGWAAKDALQEKTAGELIELLEVL
ncbi:MAG: hypothetical protein PHH77_03540 [Victivallaceae bacterium]|nr:hypothetical protein [Victivallaceae bacterium]